MENRSTGRLERLEAEYSRNRLLPRGAVGVGRGQADRLSRPQVGIDRKTSGISSLQELGADERAGVAHERNGRRARDGRHRPHLALHVEHAHVVERLLVRRAAEQEDLPADGGERAADARVGPAALRLQLLKRRVQDPQADLLFRIAKAALYRLVLSESEDLDARIPEAARPRRHRRRRRRRTQQQDPPREPVVLINDFISFISNY